MCLYYNICIYYNINILSECGDTWWKEGKTRTKASSNAALSAIIIIIMINSSSSSALRLLVPRTFETLLPVPCEWFQSEFHFTRICMMENRKKQNITKTNEICMMELALFTITITITITITVTITITITTLKNPDSRTLAKWADPHGLACSLFPTQIDSGAGGMIIIIAIIMIMIMIMISSSSSSSSSSSVIGATQRDPTPSNHS